MGDRASEYSRRREMPWQRQALEYIDRVPELNYASHFYARMLKQLIIFPALLGSDGQAERIDEGLPVQLLDRIQDPAGGRSQILGNYGRLMFVTGEGSLFGRELGSERERWSFLWNDELKVEYDGRGNVTKITHVPVGGESGKEYSPEQAVVYRMWTPHPRRSGEADSPMRAVLDVAEELIVLTQSVYATAVTRMTNGVLLMPQEISPGAAEPSGDEDARNDPFADDIADLFEQQKEHPGEAAAKVPYIIYAGYEYLDRIRHLPLHDPQNDYLERDLRKEAVERLARGLDFPPEILLGLGSTNHWAALQILGEKWKSHGAALAEQFCDEVAEVYLRPSLRSEGYEKWKQVIVGYDESQVVVKPDRADDAIRAYDRGLLGDAGARALLNIPSEWAPSEEERQRYLAIKLRNPLLISENGGSPEEGPPPPGPEGDSGRRTRVVGSSEREVGAAEMALMRCRELAGLRIRNKSYWTALERNCSDCVERANGKSNELVASAIGADVVLSLGADPKALVKGGSDPLRSLLITWGHPETQAEALCEMIETFAARTLFEEEVPTLSSGLVAHIEQMKEVADALLRQA